jgi:lysozyme
MSLINYNLQQEQQTAKQTGTPVTRYEYAQGLQEFTDAVVPLERSFLQGYEQQQKKAAQQEDEILLNQYRDKAYKIKRDYDLMENPSPARLQDDLNTLKNQFPTLASSKMFAVDKDLSLPTIKPYYIQAGETTEKYAGEKKAEVDKDYYNLGVDYLGIDKASSMTPDAVIQQGKQVAADSEALGMAVNVAVDPNSSDTVKMTSLQTVADISSNAVGEEVSRKLEAGQMITKADLDLAKEKLIPALTSKGLTPSQATWVANRAVYRYNILGEVKEATLEDQKKLNEQVNANIKLSLDTRLMEATGVTSEWLKSLEGSPWLLSASEREALHKAAQGVMADRDTNAAIINSFTGGNPLDLTRLGENLDKALRDPIYTNKQKAAGLNAATQALSIADVIPANININMPLEEISRVIKEDADTAEANFNWLNNKYRENSGALIDTLNKSDMSSKVATKNDYTAATLGTINKKLLQAFTDTQGPLEYSKGTFKSSAPVDEAFVNELNGIVSSAKITNAAAGYTLLDNEALDTSIKQTLSSYKLDKPNNLRGDQKMALLFTPVLAAGQASHTERQQAVLGNRIEEEPWLKTFQAGLTGAELGGAAGGAFGGGAGAFPGAIAGGAAGLVGGAYANFPAVRGATQAAGEVAAQGLDRLSSAVAPKGFDEANKKAAQFLTQEASNLLKAPEKLSNWVDEVALKITKAIFPDAGAAEVDFAPIPQEISEGKIKEDTKERIKAEEGLKTKVYKDTQGNETVGYGIKLSNLLKAQGADAEEILKIVPNLTSIKSTGINEQQAEALLDIFLSKAELDAERFVGSDVFSRLTPARQQALIDMAYNMGGNSLRTFVNLKDKLSKGDYEGAAKEITSSAYGKQLKKRAKRNSELMRRGTF